MPKKTTFFKRITAAAAAFFYLTSFHLHTGFTAAPADAQVSRPDFSLPRELGRVKSVSRAESTRTVFLIEDAHSVPSAQERIHGLIDYLAAHEDAALVALEGADGRLDTAFLRAFPDRKLLEQTLDGYREKGELSGGAYAALTTDRGLRFFGAEDWTRYEEGLALYAQAQERAPALSRSLSELRSKLETMQQKEMSGTRLEAARAILAFRSEEKPLVDTLKAVSAFTLPDEDSPVNALVAVIRSGASVEAELDRIARERAAEASARARTMPEKMRLEFESKKQDLMTSRLSPADFIGFLVSSGLCGGKGEEARIEALLAGHRTLRDMESTALLEAVEAYFKSAEEKIYDSAGARETAARLRLWYLLTRLAGLRLHAEEWKELESAAGKNGGANALAASVLGKKYFEEFRIHRAFYESTRSRDRIFAERLAKSLVGEPHNAVLVAGGFHTANLVELLGKQRLRTVVISPAVSSMPSEPLYENHMRGEVSWKSYLDAERKNGAVDIHAAFLKSVRDRLLEGAGTSSRGRLIAEWRARAVRAATEDGTDAAFYTSLLDEVMDRSSMPRWKQEWLDNADRLAAKVRDLRETALPQAAANISGDVDGAAVLGTHLSRHAAGFGLPEPSLTSAADADALRSERRAQTLSDLDKTQLDRMYVRFYQEAGAYIPTSGQPGTGEFEKYMRGQSDLSHIRISPNELDVGEFYKHALGRFFFNLRSLIVSVFRLEWRGLIRYGSWILTDVVSLAGGVQAPYSYVAYGEKGAISYINYSGKPSAGAQLLLAGAFIILYAYTLGFVTFAAGVLGIVLSTAITAWFTPVMHNESRAAEETLLTLWLERVRLEFGLRNKVSQKAFQRVLGARARERLLDAVHRRRGTELPELRDLEVLQRALFNDLKTNRRFIRFMNPKIRTRKIKVEILDEEGRTIGRTTGTSRSEIRPAVREALDVLVYDAAPAAVRGNLVFPEGMPPEAAAAEVADSGIPDEKLGALFASSVITAAAAVENVVRAPLVETGTVDALFKDWTGGVSTSLPEEVRTGNLRLSVAIQLNGTESDARLEGAASFLDRMGASVERVILVSPVRQAARKLAELLHGSKIFHTIVGRFRDARLIDRHNQRLLPVVLSEDAFAAINTADQFGVALKGEEPEDTEFARAEAGIQAAVALITAARIKQPGDMHNGEFTAKLRADLLKQLFKDHASENMIQIENGNISITRGLLHDYVIAYQAALARERSA